VLGATVVAGTVVVASADVDEADVEVDVEVDVPDVDVDVEVAGTVVGGVSSSSLHAPSASAATTATTAPDTRRSEDTDTTHLQLHSAHARAGSLDDGRRFPNSDRVEDPDHRRNAYRVGTLNR